MREEAMSSLFNIEGFESELWFEVIREGRKEGLCGSNGIFNAEHEKRAVEMIRRSIQRAIWRQGCIEAVLQNNAPTIPNRAPLPLVFGGRITPIPSCFSVFGGRISPYPSHGCFSVFGGRITSYSTDSF